MINLDTKYLGLKLRNPIIAASSGLTESLDHLKAFEDNGAGAVVLKSLFEEEILREMNESMTKLSSESYIYPETLGFYDDEDSGHMSTDRYLKLISDAKQSLNIPVIASINCVSSEEWTYFPKIIQQTGADALELNMFILPTDLNRSSDDNEKLYFDIISEVKKNIDIPIAVKISPYFSNLAQMLQKISHTGIDALVLFNKFYSPDIDIIDMKVTGGHVLSSASDIAQSLRWTAIMANRLDCDIAATTGINDGHAVIKQLLAGAKAVQVASAFYRNGIEFINKMTKEIKEWMEEKEYKKIEDFRGKMSQDKIKNPADYERVQFMKYFRAYPYIK